jgi:hypothetical protein
MKLNEISSARSDILFTLVSLLLTSLTLVSYLIRERHWFNSFICNTSLYTFIHVISHYMFRPTWSSSDVKIVFIETVVLPLSWFHSCIASVHVYGLVHPIVMGGSLIVLYVSACGPVYAIVYPIVMGRSLLVLFVPVCCPVYALVNPLCCVCLYTVPSMR